MLNSKGAFCLSHTPTGLTELTVRLCIYGQCSVGTKGLQGSLETLRHLAASSSVPTGSSELHLAMSRRLG